MITGTIDIIRIRLINCNKYVQMFGINVINAIILINGMILTKEIV